MAAWLALASLALSAAGCGSGDRPPPVGGPPAATPQVSVSAPIEATAALLRATLAEAGRRLDPALVPYRPSEPASVAGAPRAVFQVDVSDTEQGFVVVYEFPDTGTAAARGRDFADHLESGFGQTNYPLDAQFSLTQVGTTLVFTWWSRETAADRDASEAAFDAIAAVGAPIEVRK